MSTPATGLYLLITIVMTWPLARGLTRDVPWHLGDSLLNMWIVAWDAEQLKAILGGDLSRIRTFFDANIFYPEPLTLAYSEHLVAQALQMFPIYLATSNPILCYNLLFLSTFVLSGVGMFLLVRELTDSAGSANDERRTTNHAAAFLAGLLFAFAPYRVAQASHLQVLSVQWMPFAVYGFRRYFETGRRRPLVGAAAALVAQNLSCGYYLLYFAPLAGLYVVWEIATRSLWRDRRMWTELAAAAAAVIVFTLPFLLPYKEVRDSQNLSRNVTEVVRYSADVYSYFTASPSIRAWGDVMSAFPKREGELFLGVVPMLLGAAAFVALFFRPVKASAKAGNEKIRKVTSTLLTAIALAYASLALIAIFTRRVDFDLLLFQIRATNITRLLAIALVAGAAAVILSPGARARAAAAFRQPEAIFVILAVLAWWSSLGPSPRAYGRGIDLWTPYVILLEHVPGYEGVRVPARLAMVVAFALAVLGGLVVARLSPRSPEGAKAGIPRRTWMATAVLGLAFLLESHALPMPVNGVSPLTTFATPEARVYRPARAPAIYHDLAPEHPDTVVLEMPLGQPDYDVRAVYYSTVHWKKLVNGYSGFFPPHYSRLAAILRAFERDDDIAWRALEATGVTHIIVHEAAYLDEEGVRFSAWLREHHAAEVSRRDRDVMFELPH